MQQKRAAAIMPNDYTNKISVLPELCQLNPFDQPIAEPSDTMLLSQGQQRCGGGHTGIFSLSSGKPPC